MAKVNLVSKKVKMEITDIVKYQLLTHSYINKIILNDTELSCLAVLGVLGESEVTLVCDAVSGYLFKTSQSIRNCVVKLEKQGLIVRSTVNKKLISLNPNLNIQAKGNILLDFKFVHLGTEES